MRITLVISSLQRGGAERVMSIMANYWIAQGHDVTLLTIDPLELDTFELHPGIKRLALGLSGKSETAWQGFKNNIPRILRLRKVISELRPDVAISFMDRQNVMTVMATFGLPIPLIISERVDPRYEKINFYWNWARRLVYRFADALVIQAESIRPWTRGIISADRVHVIPNPVHLQPIERNPEPDKIIVGMGRLVYQKGFDLLLNAFARCTQKYPDWRLVILGEGPERDHLKRLILELSLKEKVELPGVTMNPVVVLQKASLFVLSSRWEGFPNALLEAMACGLPVISFDCPSGPSEIIRHEVDGLLVPLEKAEALTEAMLLLMENEDKRNQLGAKAVEVHERFALDKIMGQWEVLCQQVSHKA